MSTSRRKILVTGHTGFVGRTLTPMLEQLPGTEVVGVSRSTGFDLTMPRVLNGISNPTVIVHLAGFVGVPQSWQQPFEAFQNNTMSTLNALELARVQKIPLIYLSSYIYGAPQYLPVDEAHPPNPGSPYAYSKRAAEVLCEGYASAYSIPILVLRPFNIYGPRQEVGVVAEIVAQAKAADTIKISDRTPKRDYLHVSDLASAIKLAVMREPGCGGLQTFNIGTGISHSVEEVIALVSRILRRPLKIECSDCVRPNEIPDCRCNAAKFEKVFGWRPKVSLESGLRQLLECA